MTLEEFFAAHPKTALAFSGGVDSAFLLQAGLACGADIKPYYVSSAFQPAFERRDALCLAQGLGAETVIIELDVLSCPEVASNPPERCYYCKRLIMGAIKERAARDGYDIVLDGTNASDDSADRPGMRALQEAGVLSPLRLCGLTKAEIRARSRENGLFTWNKPAYACLATRIPAGEEISASALEKTEKSEDALFELGFTDFRVRQRGGAALLQFTAEQKPAAERQLAAIKKALSPYYTEISIDPKEREKSL